MKDKDINLAYKGDWYEQTAELAKALGDYTTMQRNYQRAIEAYETGGWLEQALKVAKLIENREKIRELEDRLK